MPLVLTPTAGTGPTVLPYTREMLSTIRQRVGLLMRALEFGPVTAATASTFTAEFVKKYPDNAQPYVGAVAFIVQGTGAGQTRQVTATTQATGVGTVSPNWTTTPDTSSVIEVWRGGYSVDEVNNKINLAILDAQEVVWIPDRQNPPSQDTTNYQWVTLPAPFLAIYRMMFRDPSSGAWTSYQLGSDPSWLDEHPRTAVMVGSTLYLSPRLTASIPLTNIFILGYRVPQLLVNDTDLAEVRSDFLVYKAALLLEAGDAGGQEVDPEQHGGRSANWEREMLQIRAQLELPLEPDTQLVKP